MTECPVHRDAVSRASERIRTQLHRAGRASMLMLACLIVLAGSPASALDLKDAKSSGKVGEQLDGYLGVVDSDASDEVKDLIRDINAKRHAKYEGIAKQRGTSTGAVAALAGSKLIARAGSGAYVEGRKGNWVRKK